MYEHVLVATDGGEGVEAIVDHAVAVAGDHDATVHALYVVNQRLYLASDKDEQDEVIADLRERGEDAVEAVADRAEAAGLASVTAIRDGVPGPEILEYATDAGVDLVVIGTHDPTDRQRPPTLGSVAERVIDEARAPVLSVRLDAG